MTDQGRMGRGTNDALGFIWCCCWVRDRSRLPMRIKEVGARYRVLCSHLKIPNAQARFSLGRKEPVNGRTLVFTRNDSQISIPAFPTKGSQSEGDKST